MCMGLNREMPRGTQYLRFNILSSFNFHTVFGYSIMMKCWIKAQEDRPSFNELYCTVSQCVESLAGYMLLGFNPFTGNVGELEEEGEGKVLEEEEDEQEEEEKKKQEEEEGDKGGGVEMRERVTKCKKGKGVMKEKRDRKTENRAQTEVQQS